ncbi:MAG: hypothetical protein MRJ93_08145 [Nitrososphaeraceae archaeon]|nr:hypothetical protein [Nitrososphaeraceae archaeon]
MNQKFTNFHLQSLFLDSSLQAEKITTDFFRTNIPRGINYLLDELLYP